MSYKNSFVIDAVTFSKVFRNNHYIEQKVKDAIADQFRKKTSLRPSVHLKDADIRINVHVNETFFTVSLDSSGESLHKRGYRKELHSASLSEVLAAGLTILSGWTGDQPLLNPMCGSGTIAIEAAMIAADIYPGITGRKYAFQNWPDYDVLLFDRLLEAMPLPRKINHPIMASDIDAEAIRITRANVRAIGLEDFITIEKKDFFQSSKMDQPTFIIMNPPYGERLEVENLGDFYQKIGSTLKHMYPGSKAWIFTVNTDSAKSIGLRPEKKLTLFNGSLECRFLNYSLFEGERKRFNSNSV
jgi:putative N6-adenine-specific DNA methylase